MDTQSSDISAVENRESGRSFQSLIVWGKKVQVGKDQEKAQSERDSHSKNRGGKKQTNNQALIP